MLKRQRPDRGLGFKLTDYPGDRRDGAAEITLLLNDLRIEIFAFAEPYISPPLAAYSRFGKGVDPRARLNLGGCASYAFAKGLGMPLLFKGSDFTHTDVLRHV